MGNLRRQLFGLLIFRVVAVTSLLMSQVSLQALDSGVSWDSRPLLLVLVSEYFFSSLWLLFFKLGVNDRVNAFFQFTGDVLVISGVLYFTGGLFSPFANLYFVVVIAAATMLYRQGAVVVASEAFVSYGVIVLLTYWVYLPVSDAFEVQITALTAKDAYFWLFLYMFGLYAVAYLTSRLSEGIRVQRTQAERSAKRVQELEEFHRTLVESMTVGLLTSDEEGWITFASGSTEHILGRDQRALEGCHIDAELLGEGSFQRLRAELEAARWARQERELLRADGKVLQLGITASGLGGPVAGYLFLLDDLTELKRLEDEVRLKDRMAALGQMAAGLAHELRNPLASMTGSVEVLGRDLELEGDYARLVNIVLKESRRLDGIIRDFLDYARPREIHLQELSLGDLARETLDLFRNSTEVSEDLSLELQAPNEVLCEADANQIRQVIWNLLRNSLDSMPDGGVLRVEVDGSEDDVRLTVRDNGVGMTEEERLAAIQPFRSGSGTGVGLGLTIVYRIIRDHGGDVRIESRKGEGTSVTVLLPRHPSTEVTVRETEEAAL